MVIVVIFGVGFLAPRMFFAGRSGLGRGDLGDNES